MPADLPSGACQFVTNLKSQAAGHIKKSNKFLVTLFCQLSSVFLAKTAL
jgi:hypothetical protein